MLIVVLLLLFLVVAMAVVALFSAHIPGVRVLTGAAPLQPDEPKRCTGCIGCGGPDCAHRQDTALTAAIDTAARPEPPRKEES